MQIKKNNLAKRKFYNITIDSDLLKQINMMAAQLNKRQNELIEEAIQDLLMKYKDLDRPEPSATELFLIQTLTKDT
jgi:metal-responsive CopG/Arc/MetJ family transcriptional regulator